jgi:thiamine monophosphate synthase
MFYAQSTGGFYLPDQTKPADAIEISEPEHNAMLDALNNGGSVKIVDGRPAAFGYVASLDDVRAARVAAVSHKANALLDDGYPVAGGQHISMSDASRADLSAMATTALAATAGAVSWPDSYKIGWITTENIRVPLDTPAEGLALAASVGDYYARIKQYARSLKDELLAADDETALNAIDIDHGWDRA